MCVIATFIKVIISEKIQVSGIRTKAENNFKEFPAVENRDSFRAI